MKHDRLQKKTLRERARFWEKCAEVQRRQLTVALSALAVIAERKHWSEEDGAWTGPMDPKSIALGALTDTARAR